MIKCKRCSELKNDSEFSKSKGNANGLSSWCKKCHSDNYKQKKFKSFYLHKSNELVKEDYDFLSKYNFI